MTMFENDCCDCESAGYICRGMDCSRRHARHYYCDRCGEEKELYYYGDEELCEDCLIENFEKVNTDDN